MAIYRVVLAFPLKNCLKLKQKFNSSKEIAWLYLGKDFFKRCYLEKELGDKFKRVDIARLHDEVANNIRHEHVYWIDELNRLNGQNLDWWFGPTSSRNIYASNLFQYCCYLEILERIWSEQNSLPELIVIESFELAQAIKKWTLRKNFKVEVFNYSFMKQGLLVHILISFLRWGKFTAILLLRWMAAYATKIRHKPKNLTMKPVVIVDTFVHDYCLSDNGVFKDRYFPYLHEYFSKKKIRVLVHPVLHGFRFNFYSIYKRMRQSKTIFILREDFLCLSDYLYALTYPLRVLRKKIIATPFRSFDLSNLLKMEHRGFTSGFQAALIYRLFLRLGKAKLQPALLINWYENQVIDKALIAGFRQAFPTAKIIGAQMFIDPPNWLSSYPSQSEAEVKVVPHLLLETSEQQCIVAQSFTKTIPCQSAGALRYSHLFNGENVSESERNREQNGQSIMVLLPFDMTEAVELLETVKDSLSQIRDDIRMLIKGHPDYSSRQLMQAFGVDCWPVRFEIFKGSLSEAFKLTSIVISSNSSSMIEAAAKGIPVIFLGRQTALNLNPLSGLNMKIATECFSPAELVNAINRYIELSPAEKIKYKKLGTKVRNLYFTPVNEETLQPFLNLERSS